MEEKKNRTQIERDPRAHATKYIEMNNIYVPLSI